MTNDMNSRDLQRRRSQAVKTAWILGLVALAIFATFIGMAVVGR